MQETKRLGRITKYFELKYLFYPFYWIFYLDI
jgi:hypothetical protein